MAFVISNKIACKLTALPTGVSERIMTMRVQTMNECYIRKHTLMKKKKLFYQSLVDVVDKVPKEDKPLSLEDFNTGVCKDHVTYEGVMGKFGKGSKNSNGDLLLSFCSQRSLCITNTYFYQPENNYFTWKHPRSNHLHLLDYILTRNRSLSKIL